LAPPELLDDDAAESEPRLSSPPNVQIEPEPPQKPGVNNSTPLSRMTSSEKLALYQKLCAEDEEKAKARANKP